MGLQKWIQGAANYASSLLMYFLCGVHALWPAAQKRISKDLRRQGRPLELHNRL